MDLLKTKKGISIIAVVMMMTTLTVMGMAVTYFVATGAVSKANEAAREKAFGLIQAGFEYALMQASSGTNPNGHVRNLGQGQFSVQYQTSGLITITASVDSARGTASQSYSIQGPPLGSLSDCLIVNTSGASLAGGGTIVQGVTVRNNCNGVINISGMTETWNPAASEKMTAITIDGTPVYTDGTGVTSGTLVTFGSPYAMSACGAALSMSSTFDSSMASKNFTLLYTMSDSSTRSATLNAISNQSACLTVNSSAAAVGSPPNYTNLTTITLTNSCSDAVTINGMDLTWSPSAGRNVTAINLSGGGNEWTGNAASTANTTFTTPFTIAGNTSGISQQITFAGDMRGVNYSLIRYRMGDSTNLDTSVNLYASNMGACLSPNTAGAYVPASPKTDIVGEVWSNTCTGKIIVNSIYLQWTVLNGNAKLNSLIVNGVEALTAPGGKNTTLPFASSGWVTINGTSSVTVTRYRFDRNINSNATFNPRLGFFDGTTYTIPSYNPPNM